MLRFLFERLDTSPSQEKVILDAADAVREAARKSKAELRQTGEEVARALRQEQLDPGVLRQGFGRHDTALAELREAVLNQLARVHEVLDEQQRRSLADLLERFGGRFGGHPHGQPI